MQGKVVTLLIGCLLGGAVAAVVWPGGATKKPTPRTERTKPELERQTRIEELEKENKTLQAKLASTQADLTKTIEQLKTNAAKLKELHGPEPEAAVGPVTDEELEAGIREFAGQLTSIIVSGNKEPAEKLRALLKRAGPAALEKIEAEFLDPSKGFQRRVIAAHVLGQSGDPEAYKMLRATLRDPDRDMVEHRAASHALAFSDDPDAVPILTDAAQNGKEPGVRANSAFGLVKRGIDEGYKLYAEATDWAFEQKQPEAMQYLQGFFLMDEKALPFARERLMTYKNETALVILIELAKRKKDKGALENLNKLAYDSSQPKSVQNAAQGAIKAISDGG